MSLNKIDSPKIKGLITEYALSDIDVVVKDNEILIVLIKINRKNLKDNWKPLNSILSEKLEKFINNVFIRWNVYILYIVNDSVSKEVKYKIENNTFFARKIVDDNCSLELTEENIQELIEKHITFEDIKLLPVQNNEEKYISESKVYLALKGFDSIDSDQIKKILETLEKDVQDEI